MIYNKFGVLALLTVLLGCSAAPKSGNKLSNTTDGVFSNSSILDDSWEDLRDAKIHYAQALIAEEISDTLRMKEEYEMAVMLLSEIEIQETTSALFEKEFQATANKVSKDYQFALRRLQLKYGDSSEMSLMEKLELFDSINDTAGLGMKMLQEFANNLDTKIPLDINSRVMRIIRFFQTEASESFELWLKRKGAYEEMFGKILEEEDLPKELVYLAMVESGFSPRAYSWAHAAGPWQFIYGTGRLYGLKRDWWVDERRNPVKSTYAAAKYIKNLYAQFGDWYLVMAAYNSGEGRVKSALKREGTTNYWELSTLPRETRNYVPSFIAATIIGENPTAFGFDVIPDPPLSFEEVIIKGSIKLSVISKAAEVTLKELINLNPELRRRSTPPRNKGYSLLLPKGTKERFNKNFAELPASERTGYVRHKVKRGEALSTIATKYGVSVSQIVSLNEIRNRNAIRAGKMLVIPTGGKVFGAASSKKIESRTAVPKNSKALKYRVRNGDTLGHIAEYFNTSALKLRKWNGLRYSKPIYEGEVMKIYLPKYLNISQPKFSVADPRLFLAHHRIIEGETLSLLAEKYAVKADEIRLWNSLKGIEIKKGSVFQLWTMKVTEDQELVSSKGLMVHTVRRGDTLWDIAKKNGVTLTQMIDWNPWTENAQIKPGDRLKIYN